MGVELAKAFITVRADSSRLRGDFNKVKQRASSSLRAIGSQMTGLLASAGITVGIAALINATKEFIALAEVQIQAERRVAAIIRTTGKAAGFTAEQIREMASEMQKKNNFGDEEILEASALLLTFKSISGDVFKRTLQAAQDLSAAGFGDLKSQALSLAKAIEDPARQMSILRRSGVTLSESQEKLIKDMQASGDLFGAQTELLAAIEGQAKDTAEELAKTPVGRIKAMNLEIGDLKEKIGTRLIPVLEAFTKVLLELVKVLEKTSAVVEKNRILFESLAGVTGLIVWLGSTKEGVEELGKELDGLGDIIEDIPENIIGSEEGQKGIALLADEVFNVTNKLTEAQIAMKEFANVEGVSPDQVKRFNELTGKLEGFRKQQEAMKKNEQFLKKSRSQAQRKRERLQAEGRRLVDSMKTPIEKLRDERDRISELFQQGVITQETMQKAFEDLREEPEEKKIERLGFRQLGRNIQDALLKGKDDKDQKRNDLLQIGIKKQDELIKAVKEPQVVVGALI